MSGNLKGINGINVLKENVTRDVIYFKGLNTNF